MTYQLIWGKGAIADHAARRTTRRLLAHRISGIDKRPVADCGFLAQIPKGTPYILLHQETGELVESSEVFDPQYV